MLSILVITKLTKKLNYLYTFSQQSKHDGLKFTCDQCEHQATNQILFKKAYYDWDYVLKSAFFFGRLPLVRAGKFLVPIINQKLSSCEISFVCLSLLWER